MKFFDDLGKQEIHLSYLIENTNEKFDILEIMKLLLEEIYNKFKFNKGKPNDLVDEKSLIKGNCNLN